MGIGMEQAGYWITVVDDEALSLTNVRSLLRSRGMKVSCLHSGRNLLKFMRKNDPDLILLDLIMPGMDGFETIQALREYEKKTKRNETPVIILTGDCDIESEQRGLKAGASDFIRKPFNKDILVRRINNAIENNRKIETLTEEATLDKLTGLMNKANGTSKIEEFCKTETGALMIFDLDSFKAVNDLYGHDMGDKVLEVFAEIVRDNTREDDVATRIGGDEFMVFFKNIISEEAVEALTKRINEQLLEKASALMGPDFIIPMGISVGAVFVPKHGKEFTELFQYADSCLLNVKQHGKHGYEIYRPRALRGLALADDLDKELIRLTHIAEERDIARHAMLLGQDAFITNYRFIMRLIKCYKRKATKVLFSLKEKEEDGHIYDVAAEFGEVLKNALRKSDIMMQNKVNQFFLLLPGLADEDASVVIERVLDAWCETQFSETTTVEYVTELISFEESGEQEKSEK